MDTLKSEKFLNIRALFTLLFEILCTFKMQWYKILKILAAYVISTSDNFSTTKTEVQWSEYNAIIDKTVHDLKGKLYHES